VLFRWPTLADVASVWCDAPAIQVLRAEEPFSMREIGAAVRAPAVGIALLV
jgi:hypothetical protein